MPSSFEELTQAQSALADNAKGIAAVGAEIRELEQSRAAWQARLADLEVGKGAPDKVSDWLKLKASIAAQIAEATAELASGQERVNALARAQPALAARVDLLVRSALISISSGARAKLAESLASAAKAAAECMGLDLYLRKQANEPGLTSEASTKLHQAANQLPGLPGAVRELVRDGSVTDALIDAQSRRWSAIAAELRDPKPEPAADVAAE